MPPSAGGVPRAIPAQPWRSFLQDLDERLKATVELRCLGGFVVTQQYGIGRETSDIDFLSIVARSREDDVEALASVATICHYTKTMRACPET
jgi:hypothetical protein